MKRKREAENKYFQNPTSEIKRMIELHLLLLSVMNKNEEKRSRCMKSQAQNQQSKQAKLSHYNLVCHEQ